MKIPYQSALVVVLLFLSGTSLPADTFEVGTETYEQGEYASATEAFTTAVDLNETAAARHNLALANFRQGNLGQAVWELERAVLLDPRNAEYRYKLGALRQEIGLFENSPSWYQVFADSLTINQWIWSLSITFWILLATLLLPWIYAKQPGIVCKLVRGLSLVALCLTVPMLWHSSNTQSRGILIANENIDLHAAPASAAPIAGAGRPGERVRILQSHNDFYEVLTEADVQGWVSGDHLRPLISAPTDT